MTRTTYAVSGMTCAHCVAAVTEEVGRLDGVTAVEVDLVAGGDVAGHRDQHGTRCRRGGRARPSTRPATELVDDRPMSHEPPGDDRAPSRRPAHRRHDLRLLRGADREEAQPDAGRARPR